MIVYKKEIMKELAARGYSANRMRKDGILSESTMQRIRKGESISLKALNVICLILRCSPNDVIEIKPTDEEKIKYF